MRPALPLRSCVLLSLAAFPGGLTAQEAPAGDPVGRDIDEITRPPSYDWLRDPRRGAGDDEVGEGSGRTLSDGAGRPRRARSGDGEGGCDYQPAPGKPPGEGAGGKDPPAGRVEGCGVGKAPGASGPAKAPDDKDAVGCGAERGGGCEGGGGGCEGGPGDCACDREVGSCGCGGIGRAVAPVGYLFAALLLGLLVLLVVRAVLRRERRSRDSEVRRVVATDFPEQVRLSQVAAVPVETMMDKAAAAAARDDFRAAVGWAYLAGLSALHRGGFVDLNISTTNLKVIDETRRRGGPHGVTSRLVRVFEDLFFGARPAEYAHWQECRRIVEEELGTLPSHRL
ncbi:MAG TPA: hypothetical protein VM285_11405 [Polyangia bacterium]|nr:hypothetical protein [Polyangia bacterium]